MRTLLCLFFCMSLFEAVAQPDRNENIGNKFSFFMVMNMGNAVGNYRTVLKEGNKAGTQFGLSGGLLVNPFSRKKASPIMLGIEYGGVSYWEHPITSYPGKFYVSSASTWLNGIVRYRPIVWSSRFNPYVDVFLGPKFINSNLAEKLNEEESQVLQRWKTTTLNYGLGIGAGLKLVKREKNFYLDVGVYYQQADASKILKPNSVIIDNSFGITSTQILTNTNQLVSKIGLTWFGFGSR